MSDVTITRKRLDSGEYVYEASRTNGLQGYGSDEREAYSALIRKESRHTP